MGVFEQFPYTNFHDLNLDWILKKMKDLDKEVTEYIKNNKIQSADPFNWTIQSQYPANTLVADPENNTVYLSVQAVPAGVALSNKEYWQSVFTLQALWDALDDIMESVAPINQGASTLAQQQMEVNELFWLHHNLYIVTSQILKGSEITNANSRAVTIEEMLLQAQSYLTQKINKNTDDIEALQEYDKQQDTRISNIVAQAGTDNTEIVDARKWSDRFGTLTSTTLGDAIRAQLNRTLAINTLNTTLEIDCNDINDNSIYISNNFKNAPNTTGFLIAFYNNLKWQIFISYTSAPLKIYSRYYFYGSFTEWKQITLSNGLLTSGDANDIKNTGLTTITSGFSNIPSITGPAILITLRNECYEPHVIDTLESTIQILIDIDSTIYTRFYTGNPPTWRTWNTINPKEYKLPYEPVGPNEQYKTINSALDAGITNILLLPGTYNERVLSFNKEINIIGLDPAKTIIQSTGGLYGAETAQLNAGTFRNLTFKSLKGDTELESSQNGSYAVHVEEQSGSIGKNNTCAFYNCNFNSAYFPGLGVGLSSGQTLILDNCTFISEASGGNYSTEGGLGALYIHNNQNELQEANVIINNCIIKSTILKNTICLYNLTKQPWTIRANNITSRSATEGWNNAVWFRNGGFVEGQFSLDNMSRGNSDTELNA